MCLNLRLAAALAATLAVAACGSITPADKSYTNAMNNPADAPQGGIFGENGLSILGGNSKQPQGGGAGIGVNTYLWRASLDTVSFMPLASADPFGGVIITDWYNPPETPDERFKINIYIFDRQLRADGVRATVFRQRRESDGRWVDSTVEPATASDFENTILTRARQLRVDTATKQ
jgi:hypothetical protein